MIRVDGSFQQQLQRGSVSLRGGLGSGLCVSSLGAKPRTWGLGIGLHNFYIYRVPTLNWTQLSNWTNYPELVTWPCSLRSQSFKRVQSSVVSDSLWPHGLQHARLPCPSPTPRACLNSCPSSQWCQLTILSCRPLLLPLVFPSIKVFSSESVLRIRWPKDWSSSISPFNEYSGLISFRMDWLDFLAVQGTLKSLLQHHSSKTSILQCSAFFMVQLSHPYMTTGKTIAFTGWTFVHKVMSLLFNMLSRFVTAFLPRNNHLLISRLQSPSAVILEPKKIKSHSFHCFLIYLPRSDGTGCHEFHFLNVEFFLIYLIGDWLLYNIVVVFAIHRHESAMGVHVFSECWVLSQVFHSPLSVSSRGSLVPLRFLP